MIDQPGVRLPYPTFPVLTRPSGLLLRAVLALGLFNQDSKVGEAESVVNHTPNKWNRPVATRHKPLARYGKTWSQTHTWRRPNARTPGAPRQSAAHVGWARSAAFTPGPGLNESKKVLRF
jgi:hypothetical protein